MAGDALKSVGLAASIGRAALAILVFMISVGWLVPLWLAWGTFSSWCRTEVDPAINGHVPQMNSLPLFHTTDTLFRFGLTWMSVVVVGWAGYFCIRFIALSANRSQRVERDPVKLERVK